MTFKASLLALGLLGAGQAVANTGFPSLPDVFATAPQSWSENRYQDPDTGKSARYGVSLAQPGNQDLPVLLLLPGMTEFSEKYFEVIKDFNAQGYEVWQLDWYSQGLSDRFANNPQKVHIPGFDVQSRLLRNFVRDKLRPAQNGRKLVLVAHSMGGHFALRALAETPDLADAAVLSAPMVEINPGGVPSWLVRLLAYAGDMIGMGENYAPGRSDWVHNPGYAVTDSMTTSDPERYAVHEGYYLKIPGIVTAGPTFGWIRAAYESRDWLLKKGHAGKISVPLLVGSAENDYYVLNEAQDQLCVAVSGCKMEQYAGAKHELFMERDEIRDAWMRDISVFLAGQSR